MEVAPFTGKVPMPPGNHTEGSMASGIGGDGSSATTTASPQKLPASGAATRPAAVAAAALPATALPSPTNNPAATPKMAALDSVIAPPSGPADASGSNGSAQVQAAPPPTSSAGPPAEVASAPPAGSETAAEHLFTPIAAPPAGSSASGGSTWAPNARLAGSSSAAGSEDERKDRSKHKKKSKDKDREKDRRDPSGGGASGKAKASSGSSSNSSNASASASAAPFNATNGSLFHPAMAVDPSGNPAAGSDPHISNGLGTAPSDPSREDVQSPAYSDISDANDQSPILDADLPEGSAGSKKDKLMTEALQGAAPAVAPPLGPYGMYPFYSQSPFMVPPTPAASGGGSGIDPSKVKEERRESSGGAGPPTGGAPPIVGADAPKTAVVQNDPFKALPANPHMQYPPFGFIPPYPAYPMDPLMVDPAGLRVSGTKTPEGTRMSPGRTKAPPLGDDPATLKDQSGSNNNKVTNSVNYLMINK